MIEYRAGPGACVVTSGAGRGKSCIHVVGIGGACVVGLMTAIAVGGNCSVVVVRVAESTRHREMRACERKRRTRVIEGRRNPSSSRVADGAVGREAGTYVIRVGG